jgi:hypothetical protein
MDRLLHVRSADPIELLELSTRVFNALRRASFDTIGDVIELVESGYLMEVRNIGQKSAQEVKHALACVRIVDEPQTEAEWESESASATAERVEIPVISSDVIEWQADLVRKHITAGLLHGQAKTAGKPVSRWLLGILSIDRRRAYETMASIIGGSINVCEELAFLLDRISRSDYVHVLVSRYGYEPRTLEEIGSEMDVTRERVRQIAKRLHRKIGAAVTSALKASSSYEQSLLRMQTCLLIAQDMGLDITYKDWKGRTLSSGLVGTWTSHRYSSLDPHETMLAVCNLLADEAIEELQVPMNLRYAINLAASGSPETRAKIGRILRMLSRKTARIIARHARFCGAVHVKWISQEIDESLAQTIDILRALGYERVSSSWFVSGACDDESDVTGHDVFHHALREMFQYCGKLSSDDICCGLRLAVSRTQFPVPPPNVMGEILALHGYRLEDGLWYCDEQMDEQLSRGEKVIRRCIERQGPVVHHSELAKAFVDSELSFPSLHATLRRSPIFDRIDTGLYKLRGTSVSRQDMDRAQSASEPVPLDVQVEYHRSGNLIVTGNLSVVSLGLGTLTSNQFPNLSGDWNCFAKGEHFGQLHATKNEFRHLGQALEHLGCEPGDRVKLTFNTWERTVEIEKVQK